VASVRTETLAVHTFFRELIAPAPAHDADGGAMGPGAGAAARLACQPAITPPSPLPSSPVPRSSGELAGEEPLRIAVNAKHLARAMRVVVAQNSSMLMCETAHGGIRGSWHDAS
jgi:hypothetical protein